MSGRARLTYFYRMRSIGIIATAQLPSAIDADSRIILHIYIVT
jgi:hypothetical protein